MHIAVDARELGGKPTGVGTYLAHLLEEWRRMPETRGHRWTLYVPEGGRREAEGGRREAEGGRGAYPAEAERRTRACPAEAERRRREAEGGGNFERRVVPGRPSTWWEQGALAHAIRRDRPDVLFAPGYTAPVAIHVPIVLTVHDVSFFAHPEWFRAREGFRRRLLTRWSARKAQTILTDTRFSRQEIVRHLGVPGERVRVILPGVALPASPAPVDSRPPVVLYVGSIFNRRRVPDLIRAFATLASRVPDARLEIIGDNRTHPHEDLEQLLRSLGIADRVNLRSYVTDEELTSIYGQARVFAFLSEYEGFGFTPLEALARVVPVVVLDGPVAREVYEDAAVYVSAGDLAGTAVALEHLLLDPAARATQMERAERVLGRYCWPETARRTLEAIEQAGARA